MIGSTGAVFFKSRTAGAEMPTRSFWFNELPLPGSIHASPRTLSISLALGVFVSSMFPGATFAEDINVIQGRRFAEANCAKCHAIGRYGESPLAIAPPFRTLHDKYPVEDLTEPLAEGITTGHPTMPQFRLDIDQIRSLIAYLKTLERDPVQPPG